MLKVLIIFFFFVTGCAHRSGHYIKSSSNDSWKKIANRYGVEQWRLKAHNKGVRSPSSAWVFIPLKRGIMGRGYSPVMAPEHMFDSGKFMWPVPSSKKISSRFGKRWGRPHEGIDIPGRVGASILAAASGVVVYSGAGLGGYGNLTVISHQDGFFTVYAHANKNYTKKGQKVHRGQVIATIGTSGRSTGPHLHFEIRYDSKAIDPLRFSAMSKRFP